MKNSILLAAGLSLAFATIAFAQDAAPAASTASDAPAPAADQKADANKPAMKHHASRHRAHVAGDPTRIDHSDDRLVVTPTESKTTLPPSQ